MSKLKLHLVGQASGKKLKTWEFNGLETIPELNVLQFLRQQKIPIASSCFGEGVCKKCLFNQDQLACQVLLRDLFDQDEQTTIEISYL